MSTDRLALKWTIINQPWEEGGGGESSTPSCFNVDHPSKMWSSVTCSYVWLSVTYMDVVETSGDGVSLRGGSPGGAIFPVQMRQFRSKR